MQPLRHTACTYVICMRAVWHEQLTHALYGLVCACCRPGAVLCPRRRAGTRDKHRPALGRRQRVSAAMHAYIRHVAHAHANTRTRTHTHTHTQTQTHTHTCAHTHIHTHTHTHKHTHCTIGIPLPPRSETWLASSPPYRCCITCCTCTGGPGPGWQRTGRRAWGAGLFPPLHGPCPLPVALCAPPACLPACPPARLPACSTSTWRNGLLFSPTSPYGGATYSQVGRAAHVHV